MECKYQDTLVGTTNEESMHSISAGSTGVPVVMMPGYAAGAAFFFRNIQGLSSKTRLFLVDWLGTGEQTSSFAFFLMCFRSVRVL